ncbi:MAG: DUF1232 domain-containing protein [Calditrichaeota bacterium]|nr:DUF1232 domain-containing protein [Calditrichota bacterium]
MSLRNKKTDEIPVIELHARELPLKEHDFYQRLRIRVHNWQRKKGKDYKWMEYIILAPDFFHLLVKLSLDRDVPPAKKAQLFFVIAYFISPIDLIPDPIPGVGLLDDIALAAYVLNSLLNSIDPQVIQRNWAGEQDILALLKRIIKKSDEMIGSGLYRKLIRLFTGKFGR